MHVKLIYFSFYLAKGTTNVSKVVKYSKTVHLACAVSCHVAHNIAELPLIAFDHAVFGEYVLLCKKVDYDVFGKGGEFTGE